ncbi:uncharacterized protein LOC106659901, partial [Trichogramma pretiosum]|uniref:uncharacterized protein LOC106659901 n=1 Tax=Trichogramma pretiosum TaxID=7493 RepID=UPI000C71A47B
QVSKTLRAQKIILETTQPGLGQTKPSPDNFVQSSLAPTNAMGGSNLNPHTPQSIFQPTINHTGTGFRNENQWLRMPYVPPMTMPWTVPTQPHPDLVRFTGEQPSDAFQTYVPHQKRKLEAPDILDNPPPSKQFISEEKMAQHFQSLYISGNGSNAQDPVPSTSGASSSNVLPDESIAIDMDESASPRLVISDELKKLTQEPILPSTLLSKMERPSMALVLWEPPSQHLRFFTNASEASSTDKSDENQKSIDKAEAVDNNNQVDLEMQSMDVNPEDLPLDDILDEDMDL